MFMGIGIGREWALFSVIPNENFLRGTQIAPPLHTVGYDNFFSFFNFESRLLIFPVKEIHLIVSNFARTRVAVINVSQELIHTHFLKFFI